MPIEICLCGRIVESPWTDHLCPQCYEKKLRAEHQIQQNLNDPEWVKRFGETVELSPNSRRKRNAFTQVEKDETI